MGREAAMDPREFYGKDKWNKYQAGQARMKTSVKRTAQAILDLRCGENCEDDDEHKGVHLPLKRALKQE